MKICYCDESGTGIEPFAVMAGIIVDSQRMHKTKEHWFSLLESLSRIIRKPVIEFHTKDFYPGNGIWRGIDGKQRAEIITVILEWLNERKHDIIFAAIEKEKFELEKSIGKVPVEIESIWRALGFQIILGVQKHYQKMAGVKGNTIFIFDNEEFEKKQFTDLISNPPLWSDSFYNKQKKQTRLDQIVDVPYWGDSKEVSLIQIADFICFFIRRYIELKENKIQVKYAGEDARLDYWYELILKRSLPLSVIYPSRGRCEITELFYKIAPSSIK